MALLVPYMAALIAVCISELLDLSSVGSISPAPVKVLSLLANSLDISESIAVATALDEDMISECPKLDSFFVDISLSLSLFFNKFITSICVALSLYEYLFI